MEVLKKKKGLSVLLLLLSLGTLEAAGQSLTEWSDLPPLPEDKGCAGMYAGVSNGVLFCMGGANFPGKPPWEGGKKKWYDNIYMLQDGKNWVKMKEQLPFPLAYGVSVSYREKIIIIGGCNERRYMNKVFGYSWNGKNLQILQYPDLPIPLANMAGALVKNLIVIAGGSSAPTGAALKKCYALDLDNIRGGWFELKPWPGPEKQFPLCTSYQGRFYLFGGERTGVSAGNVKFREILEDAYRLTPVKDNGKWKGVWEKLAPMPKGLSAGASPVPVSKNGRFFFWGGVDALTALNTDHENKDAISKDMLLYDPDTDTWQYLGMEKGEEARVTLPAVFWDGRWLYISGEIRAGVRTNSIVSVQLK